MPILKIEAQLSKDDLLQAVAQLSQLELEQFVEEILVVKAQRQAPSLSPTEAELVLKINEDLPQNIKEQYQTLIEKRNQETLTVSEYQQLLELTEQVEAHQVQRLEYLVQLAQLRQIPLTTLIAQMEIKPINND